MTRSITLHAAAAAGAVVDDRTLTGLAVPYGPAGRTAFGQITFAQGTIRPPEDLGRVKLLRQHRADDSIGYVTALDDGPDGLRATFEIPPSPAGDIALAEAADGRRDGLSVGVILDAECVDHLIEAWLDGDDTPIECSGELLEISQVSMPAFSDARVDGSAALAAAAGGTFVLTATFTPEGNTMSSKLAATRATTETTTETTAPEGPTTVDATAGAATTHTEVTSEDLVYRFDGTGPSFVRDMWARRFDGSAAATERLAKFERALEAGDPAQLDAFLRAAVETRAGNPSFIEQGYRPDLLLEVIDRGRPLTSRLSVVPLSDATPYRIPVEGEFTSIADHVEGTAHAAEGNYTDAGSVLVEPGAISGAVRLSREVIDATNPALDDIVAKAMMRDYRRKTEAKVVAALVATTTAVVTGIDKVLELAAQLGDFYDVNLEPASFVAASTSYYATLRADVDTTGRPMLASINPVNAVGSVPTSGWTGAHVDGVEIIKAYGVDVNDAFLVMADAVHVGEKPPATFRFEEVEGPGVIKLALWSYFVAKVLRNSGVRPITSATA